MPECTSCGSPVDAGHRFCPSCGREIAVPPVPSAPPVDAARPRRGLGKALLAGCGCLGLLAVGGAVLLVAVLQLSGDATSAARRHLELVGSGDVDEAYRSASAALRDLTPLEDYREMVEIRPALRRVRDVSFPERQVESGVATVVARLEDESGRSFDVPMRLREEGDEWRLIAIDWSGVPAEPAPTPAAVPAVPPARPAVPATAAPATAAPPAAAPPAARPSRGSQPSVGAVSIGSGRGADDRLLRPGQPVTRTATQLSADIELVDHPRGGRVRVWIESAATGDRSEPVEATVEGEGSGTLTFNLDLGGQGLPPGGYVLVVLLGEDGRFETPFRAQ